MRLFYNKEMSVFARIFDKYKNSKNELHNFSLTDQFIQVFIKIGYIEDFFDLNVKDINSDAEAGSVLCDIIETGFEYTKINPAAFEKDGEYSKLILEMYKLIHEHECSAKCQNRDKSCSKKLEQQIFDVYNILEAFIQDNFNLNRNSHLYKKRMAEYKLFLERVLGIIYYEKRNLKYEDFSQICKYRC